MPLSEQDRSRIESFRNFIEESTARDDRYGTASRVDREDGSTLATRFQGSKSCWLEVAIRPLIPQIRVGFLTNDRWKSEECEQTIEDSGDTMNEFVGSAFEDAGLEWPEPPVEHYREGGEFFYFATPLKLDELADLGTQEVRDKAVLMLEGYLIAFGPAITVDDESVD
ncbi:MAG: hypothetical protein HY287_08970 [Planctomycetes bacterium]|nr:hypothetical protein [Planctomycetota bacterium]MBI3834445.1 hypothetical protein [Planctomycetota bacterium]